MTRYRSAGVEERSRDFTKKIYMCATGGGRVEGSGSSAG
jgi:hypothetical protein